MSSGTLYDKVWDLHRVRDLPGGSTQLFGVACKGDNTGMIVGDAAGSWAPYQYHWFNLNGDTLQSSPGYISTRDTLANLGMKSLKNIRQGKFFEIEIEEKNQLKAFKNAI